MSCRSPPPSSTEDVPVPPMAVLSRELTFRTDPHRSGSPSEDSRGVTVCPCPSCSREAPQPDGRGAGPPARRQAVRVVPERSSGQLRRSRSQWSREEAGHAGGWLPLRGAHARAAPARRTLSWSPGDGCTRRWAIRRVPSRSAGQVMSAWLVRLGLTRSLLAVWWSATDGRISRGAQQGERMGARAGEVGRTSRGGRRAQGWSSPW